MITTTTMETTTMLETTTMADRHKRTPISLRLPADTEAWLRDYAEAHGLALRAVILAAVAEYRERESAKAGRNLSAPK